MTQLVREGEIHKLQQYQRCTGLVVSSCRHKCSKGSGKWIINCCTRPANILMLQKTRSPSPYCVSLNLNVITEVGFTGGSAAASAEVMHVEYSKNDLQCEELGWICVHLAVETYGAWAWCQRGLHTPCCKQLTYGTGKASGAKRQLCLVIGQVWPSSSYLHHHNPKSDCPQTV